MHFRIILRNGWNNNIFELMNSKTTCVNSFAHRPNQVTASSDWLYNSGAATNKNKLYSTSNLCEQCWRSDEWTIEYVSWFAGWGINYGRYLATLMKRGLISLLIIVMYEFIFEFSSFCTLLSHVTYFVINYIINIANKCVSTIANTSVQTI